MKIYRSVLLGTVASLALAASVEAKAEQAAQTNAVQEVIVTAQRRSERLQDVPFSVTAIQGSALTATGVITSVDLPMITPGLRIESTGVFIQPVIRGITTTQSTAATEANIATYVDGVYQQSMLSSVYDLPDIESIQVLKGPQGTLFGRNATGGAILINTIKPSLTEVRGIGSISYGNFNSTMAKGFVSVPVIADKLAVSLTGLYDHTDGWKHNVLDNNQREGAGIKSYLFRGKVRFIPWEGADFILEGLYAKREDASGLKMVNYGGNNIGHAFFPNLPVASKPWTYGMDVPSYIEKTQKSVTLHGDIEVGPGTFSTTSHYDRSPNASLIDADNGAAPFGNYIFTGYARNIEQEFLYSTHQLGRFHAVGGLFYYSLLSGSELNVNNFNPGIYFKDKSAAYAAFGEGTYNLTDQLSLTAGLRYSHETRHSYFTATAAPLVGAVPQTGQHTWHAFTPRFSVLYKLTPHTNVYGTYSKGFTSGAYNSSAGQTTPVNPEHVDAFEVGVKSNEISNLSWSAAAFHYKYTGLQVTTISQNGALIIQTESNAAAAKIYGVELTGTWRVSDSFDLTAGGTYLHGRYSKFPGAVVQVPTGAGGNNAVAIDASGKTMIRAPSWSGNLTAHYRLETSPGTLDATGTVFYSTKVFQEFGNRIVQPKYALVNSTLTWTPTDSRLKFSIWGKNLTNKAVISSVIIAGSYDAVDYLPPRTFGVRADFSY
jgi:iron complex outermembrane receptor protein